MQPTDLIGRSFIRRAFIAFSLGLILIAMPPASAWGQDALDSARAAGYLGEQLDGYVGLVDPNAPADVKALMADINAKRLVRYTEIAKQNGTDVAAVQALIVPKIWESLRPGWYYQAANGSWTRK